MSTSPTSSAMQDTAFGKYRLIAKLGHGGMAEVFLAVVTGPASFNKLQLLTKVRVMTRNQVKVRNAAQWMLATLALATIGTFMGACNLIVESATDQCTTNSDCATFNNGSVCMNGVCVLQNGSSSGSGSSSGMGGGGGAACFSGTPSKDEEFFNQCTNASCAPSTIAHGLGYATVRHCPHWSIPPRVPEKCGETWS